MAALPVSCKSARVLILDIMHFCRLVLQNLCVAFGLSLQLTPWGCCVFLGSRNFLWTVLWGSFLIYSVVGHVHVLPPAGCLLCFLHDFVPVT